ncbi:MAG: KH domain-containing protein [Solirubrobacterales bacterium]|nr:KH domain-containing protein [Solirubrobacterales bacterium]
MRDLLEELARLLVQEPDAVQVEQFDDDDGTIVLELAVGSEDYGRIIGNRGRTANALRTVLKAAAVKDKRRVVLDIVD